MKGIYFSFEKKLSRGLISYLLLHLKDHTYSNSQFSWSMGKVSQLYSVSVFSAKTQIFFYKGKWENEHGEAAISLC